jgi:hypothetical protein
MENTAITEITTSELINTAFLNKIDLVVAEKMLELRAKDDAWKSKKSFARSFAMAQANIQAVIKTKTNQQTHSKYAELADIIQSAQPVYTKEGFSVICYEGDCPKEGQIRTFADVLHCDGHKETYHVDMPLDGVGFKGNANMTAIHGKKSAFTYSRNTLMCMIWNIPTSDDDGNKASIKEVITEKQLSTILDCLSAKELSEAGLLKFLKIDKLEELPASRYMEAMAAIAAKTKSTEVKK